MYTYEYPHPAITTDSVVFGFDGHKLHVLLIERGLDPCKGMWALPGGFMKISETVEQCAERELLEETGVRITFLEQFHVFSRVKRDPRERVVTVAFLALVRKSDYRLIAGDDAARANWFEIDELPPLAFDHAEIIKMARKRIREVLVSRPIAFKLLDRLFSMSELQRVYEAINGVTYDRRNFAKKMNSTGFLRSEDDDDSISPVMIDKCCSMEPEADLKLDIRCSTISDSLMETFNEDSEDGLDLALLGYKDNIQAFDAKCSKPVTKHRSKLYTFDEEAFEQLSEKSARKINPLNM